jgi:integrase
MKPCRCWKQTGSLLIYRHGLRVSEACDLRWDDVDLTKRTITLRRLKGSDDSRHYLERDELAGLKALQRSQATHHQRTMHNLQFLHRKSCADFMRQLLCKCY